MFRTPLETRSNSSNSRPPEAAGTHSAAAELSEDTGTRIHRALCSPPEKKHAMRSAPTIAVWGYNVPVVPNLCRAKAVHATINEVETDHRL